ncbi:hypothetical protein CLOP_g15822 [Closterium sp. NIES-67]|nr:hypothetical protein CLOP_g1231 [Closterium sp. NIES-67]GJP85717.1 hypothetical protein CLOP_g15822 [Closterium sp. NIES-67]
MSGSVTESDANASAALASSGAARRIAVRLLTGGGGSGNLGAKLSGSGGSGNFATLSTGMGPSSGVTSIGGVTGASSRHGERFIASEGSAAGGGSPDSLAGWTSNPKDSRRKLPQKSLSESVERGASGGTTGRKGQANAWGQCDDLMVDWLGSVAECGSADESGGPAAAAGQVAAPRRGAQSGQREGRAGPRGASGAQEERERQRERSGLDRRDSLPVRERESVPRICSDEIARGHLSRTISCVDRPRPLTAQREKPRGGLEGEREEKGRVKGEIAGGERGRPGEGESGGGLSRTSSCMSAGGDEVRRLENEIAVLRRQLVTVGQAKNAFGNGSGSTGGSAQTRAYQHSGPQGEARSPEWQSIAMEVVELRGQLHDMTEANGRITELLERRTQELVATKEELKTAKEERDALAKEMEALLESLSTSPPADVACTAGMGEQMQQQQQRAQQAEEEARRLQVLLETAMAERDMAVRLAAATGRLPAGLIPAAGVSRCSSDEPSPRLRFTPLDVRFRTSNLLPLQLTLRCYFLPPHGSFLPLYELLLALRLFLPLCRLVLPLLFLPFQLPH